MPRRYYTSGPGCCSSRPGTSGSVQLRVRALDISCQDMLRLSSRLARPLALLALGVIVVALTACGSGRRFGERGRVAQAYHNFTAHYNGFFNAEVLVEEAELQRIEGRQENYNKILPIFPAYTAAEGGGGASGGLDQAMEKVSVVVNIHRPSSYDDDSYLILGKAQLLKGEYETAEQTFAFAVKEFDPENETARLRRIEKQKIADGKEADKAARANGEQPRSRRAPPPRRKSSRPKSRRKRGATSKSRSKARSEDKSRRKSPSGKTGPDSPSPETKEEAKRAKEAAKEAEKKRKEANAAIKEKAKKGKPKSRAEMAREQREARLAEEKAAAKEQARTERDAAGATGAVAESEAAPAAAPGAPAAAPGAAAAADTAPEDDGRPEAAVNDDEMPPHGLFRHETALQDLNYWLARTYAMREKFIDAERVLGQLSRSGGTFKHVRRALPAAYADLYLRKGDLVGAAAYLRDAVATEKSRAKRARYTYILGQVHERMGDSRNAYADYKQVVKLKPDFQLAFNSTLNMVTLGYRSGNEEAGTALRALRKMAREEKNGDQRDQIYYAMAVIALESGDRDEGIGYLNQSLAARGGNAAQAALSYEKLATLYLQDENYVFASAYYDSTLQVLPRESSRYAELELYRDNLRPVAEALQTVELQDSLLAIADLPPAEQRELAARLEKERREAEIAAAIAASRASVSTPSAAGPSLPVRTRGSIGPAGGNSGDGLAASESAFFAYDDKGLRRSAKEFEREWGSRKLVDDWRTIDEREAADRLDAIIDAASPDAITDEDVEAVLADVPTDSVSRAASHLQIQTALLELGRLFREKLDNPKRAEEALAELARRYPNSDYAAEGLYLQALALDDLQRDSDATAVRRQLREKHPESKFALNLTDPEYSEKEGRAAAKLVAYYDNAYANYKAGNLGRATTELADVETRFGPDNTLQPRFGLLNAMVTGKRDGRDAYVGALREVVAKYPSSEEATRAKEMLLLLGEREGATSAIDKAAVASGEEGAGGESESPFEMAPDKQHYFLAVLPKAVNRATAKASAADFNTEHHRLDKLSLSDVMMVAEGETTPVLVVRRFSDQAGALAYYRDVQQRNAEFMDGIQFEALVISQANYRVVLRQKNLEVYQRYFNDNYL